MRHVVPLVLLLVVLAMGCGNNTGPQTTDAPPPMLPTQDAAEPTDEDIARYNGFGTHPGPEPLVNEPSMVHVPPPPAEDTTAEYVVQQGDTYYNIARRQLGSGRRWKEIAALNPGLDKDDLQIGQTIRIPAR